MNRSRRTRILQPEQGSILLALMIILIVITLVTAVAFQVIGNQSIVAGRQATAEAVSLADAGVSDALFRLDQGGSTAGYSSSTGKWSSFCVGASGCAATSLSSSLLTGFQNNGTGTVQYKVVPSSASNPSSWTIYSKATRGTQKAAVVETVNLTAQYPFALFANQSLTLNGTSNMTWTTYSSDSTIPNTSQDLAIGSDLLLSCNGNLASNVHPSYYHANGSTTGAQCGAPTTTDYSFPVPSAPSGMSPYCPNNGQYGDGASTPWPSLGTAGTTTTIYCTQPVTISGHLTINGPVKLYIILTPPAPSGYTSALGLATGSYINDEYDYCVGQTKNPTGCLASKGMPVASNFQVFTNSTLNVGNTSGHGLYFAGILDAPQAGMTENGCKGVFYGAIILSTFTCNGGSSGFTLNYDQALTQLYGPAVIQGYRQVPPSTFTVP